MPNYRKSTQVFDSADPNLPDLPDELQMFITDVNPYLAHHSDDNGMEEDQQFSYQDDGWRTDTDDEFGAGTNKIDSNANKSSTDRRKSSHRHRASFVDWFRSSNSHAHESSPLPSQLQPQLQPRPQLLPEIPPELPVPAHVPGSPTETYSGIQQSTDFTLKVKPRKKDDRQSIDLSPNFSPKQVATNVQKPPPTFMKTTSSESTSVLNLELSSSSVTPEINPTDSSEMKAETKRRLKPRPKNLSVSIDNTVTWNRNASNENDGDVDDEGGGGGMSPTTPSTMSEARLGSTQKGDRRSRRYSTAVYATGSYNRQRENSYPNRKRKGSQPPHRHSSARIAWEPGLDIENTQVIMKSAGSAVTIVDYCADRYRVVTTEVHDFSNSDFKYYLHERPQWSKVRWVNVNGLSWEAISQISHYYNLHRLAIEDMIDIPQRTKVDIYPNHTFCCFPLLKLAPYSPLFSKPRTWYLKIWGFIYDFLYGVPLNDVYEPAINKRLSKDGATLPHRRRSNHERRSIALYRRPSSSNSELDEKFDGKNKTQNQSQRQKQKWKKKKKSDEDEPLPLTMQLSEGPMVSLYQWNNPGSTTERSSYMDRRRPLARTQQMVSVEQVSLFLTNNGEIISFFERSASDVEQPILARLSIESTILRETEDPSLLFQALIDGTVDLLNPIISAYRQRMERLEFNALLNPSISHTRDLHLMNTELTLVRNTIAPLTSVLNSLRTGKQHVSTFQSIADTGNINIGGIGTLDSDDESLKESDPTANQGRGSGMDRTQDLRSRVAGTPPKDRQQSSSPDKKSGDGSSDGSIGGSCRHGLISRLASIYLADVVDHTIEYTQDLDIMRNNTRSMINLVFNTISIQSGDAVRLLSLVTVVFLPLSFLTGYFGMNFTRFESLNNGVDYYWGIAVPFAVALSFVLMYDWLRDNFRKFNRFLLKQVSEKQPFNKNFLRFRLCGLRKSRPGPGDCNQTQSHRRHSVKLTSDDIV